MRKLWTVLLFSVLIVSCLASVPTPIRAQTAKWTFMVYMGADSSLESFGITPDFEAIYSVLEGLVDIRQGVKDAGPLMMRMRQMGVVFTI